jgi:glucose-6-phosphate-specific signal transduction histidine kinase
MKHQKRLIPSLNVRIAREALGNAFHHAHAQNVEAEITYGGRQFVLRVRDNGCGIETSIRDRVWITPPGMEGTHEIITKEDGAHQRRLDSWGLFRVHEFHGFDQFWHQ